MEVAVTLLPQPDSPTSPSVRPASTPHDTPSTACTNPASVLKPTWRLSISRSAKAVPFSLAEAFACHLLEFLANAVIVFVHIRIARVGLIVPHCPGQSRLFFRIDPIDHPVGQLLRPLRQIELGKL